MPAEPLTRDQIEDLLSSTRAPKPEAVAPSKFMITAEEEDMVREYATIVATSGGTVLSGALGDEVKVYLGEIQETDPGAIPRQIPGKVVAFKFRYKGLVHGEILLNMGYAEALQLARLLSGGGQVNAIEEVEDKGLGDAIEKIITHANLAFSTRLGGNLNAELSGTAISPDDLGKLLPQSNEPQILVTYGIESDLLKGGLTQVLPRNLVHGFLEAAGRPEGAAEAVEERRYAPSVGAPEVLEQPATFQPLVSEGRKAQAPNLELILDIPLEVKVELGRTARKIRDVLELGPGSVVELEKLANEPVDILVNDKLFAKGEVVVIDENFGVRVTDILTIEERIEALK